MKLIFPLFLAIIFTGCVSPNIPPHTVAPSQVTLCDGEPKNSFYCGDIDLPRDGFALHDSIGVASVQFSQLEKNYLKSQAAEIGANFVNVGYFQSFNGRWVFRTFYLPLKN